MTSLVKSLFLLIVFGLLFHVSMQHGLNHDAHQFVASGVLLARDRIWPYFDYPYFHAPYLVFVYATLFSFSPYLLWSARFFSVVCGGLTLFLTFFVAWDLFSAHSEPKRFSLAAGSTLLLLANPLFAYTSGRAWNHDLPVLLMLLALLCYRRVASRGNQPSLLLAMSGLLVGLAIGTRLSFAVLVVPFVLMWMPPLQPDSRRWKAWLFFGGGLFFGLLPMLVLFSWAPEQAFFGNLGYAELNTHYYELKEHVEGMTIGGKFAYLFSLMQEKPGNLLLFLLWGVFLLTAYRHRTESWRAMMRKTTPSFLVLLCLLLFLPFLLIGAFAATPSQEQYFYPLVPILLWSLLYLFAMLPRALKWPSRLFAVVVAVSCLLALPKYMTIERLFLPSQWQPIKLHHEGKRLAEMTSSEKVLTLAPIVPLEGGLDIYPALATGPFASRVASLLSAEERQKHGLLSDNDLLELLKHDPSSAVLIGLNNNDRVEEESLLAYAKQQGYVESTLQSRQGSLWLAPLIDWGEQIRLGGYYVEGAKPLNLDQTHLLTFYLEALRPMERNLHVLVRLVGKDGQEIWRDEGWPFGSPTSIWQVGEVWPDGHQIDLPATVQPGYYRLELGFYDPANFEHLNAQTSQTKQPLADMVTLDTLVLGAPSTLSIGKISANLGWKEKRSTFRLCALSGLLGGRGCRKQG